MKLLESSRVKLPRVYFIQDKKEIKDIPIGIPFIYGDVSIENHLIRILEYEVLYLAAIRSGYPFNFRKILLEKGFRDLENYGYQKTCYMEFVTEGIINTDPEDIDLRLFDSNRGKELSDYIKDGSVVVDMAKLKELNVFPLWLNTIEEAITVNIQNYSLYDTNLYNKKLDGIYGDITMSSPKKEFNHN
jgi:hypothetical protein